MRTPGYTIVGASLAGLRAAETLRHEGFDGRIVLIGDEADLPYDRPPLSKAVLDGSRPPASAQLRPEAFYTDNEIDVRLGARAVGLRRDLAAVELADGTTVEAEKVLLATGARPRSLKVPGVELAGVWTLRTLDDASKVANELRRGAAVVVIGAGFVGAEVAATARTLGCDVTMLEQAPLPLARVLGTELGEFYAAQHRTRGVAVRCGVAVTAIEGTDRVRAVTTSDGTRHPADVVVVGVGAVPNVELAMSAGILVGNGIVVDEYCRTSNPHVFAAGDVANFFSTVVERRVRRENWQNAYDQGAAAAAAMLDRGAAYQESPWFWTDQYDVKMHMAGSPDPADEIIWRGSMDDSAFCAFYRRDGILTGAVGVNRPKDVRAALGLIVARERVGSDLLADPSIDLRKALR